MRGRLLLAGFLIVLREWTRINHSPNIQQPRTNVSSEHSYNEIPLKMKWGLDRKIRNMNIGRTRNIIRIRKTKRGKNNTFELTVIKCIYNIQLVLYGAITRRKPTTSKLVQSQHVFS